MSLWQRLAAEAAANRGKAAVLGILSLGLAGVVGRQFLPEEVAATIGLVSQTTASAADARPNAPLWMQRQAEEGEATTPVASNETIRNGFAVDPDQFPPPILFSEDPIPEPVKVAKAQPEPVQEVFEGPVVEDDAEDFPAIELQGTTAGRIAVLNGLVVRRGNTFPFSDERYTLSRVGDGWVIVTSEAGSHFRLRIRSVFRSTDRSGNVRR